MKSIQIALFVLLLAVSVKVPPVFSQGPLQQAREDVVEARQNLREEQKSLMEQVREQVGSRAGIVRNMFGFGRAAIGKGTITAKSDTALTVEKDGKSYTVNITEKTQLRRRYWGKAALTEFSVGNEVTVVGKWTDEAKTTIDAILIRNLSIQKRFGVFFGKVLSLTSTGWTMSTASENRANQSVTVSAETKFVNRRGETIIQADVKADHRVRVRGLWDRSMNTITEVKEVKDFSLPIIPTVTPTP